MVKSRNRRSMALKVGITALLFAALVLGGYFWNKNHKTNQNERTDSQTQTTEKPKDDQNTQQNQVTNNDNYLVIKEWGVKVKLPDEFIGKVTYLLGDPAIDPDGNRIQAVTIYVTKTSLDGTVCGTQETNLGSSIDSGAQYIRSELVKPFNSNRYKWTFKVDILKDSTYAYHLNYLTPDCLGGGDNATRIEALQKSLVSLEKAN